MDELKVVTVIKNEFSASSKRRFLLFVFASILVASILVAISMEMYNSSGAAQLDLSRPGYVSVRSQAVTNDDGFQKYSATGPINQTTISDFKSIYKQQSQKTKAVDAFSGDPLNPDALGISDVSNQ
ncbi:MAG TPA: hypothetical protein VMR16_01425 [Candidatus Saccharimonadales bacterium]|nr:hypothetical protein [Candidatus Saccharimonadales bacterium]